MILAARRPEVIRPLSVKSPGAASSGVQGSSQARWIEELTDKR
jgi:hypothetical protein